MAGSAFDYVILLKTDLGGKTSYEHVLWSPAEAFTRGETSIPLQLLSVTNVYILITECMILLHV